MLKVEGKHVFLCTKCCQSDLDVIPPEQLASCSAWVGPGHCSHVGGFVCSAGGGCDAPNAT